MILLIKKDCQFCEEIKNLDREYRNIYKFYVKDRFVIIDGEKVPLDQKISILPVLINDKEYYFGKQCILEFIEKSGEKINAETSVL
jgi:hypothetical protein